MIFGNITQEKTYAFLPEDLKECFAYAKEHDLASYEKGSHPIDGERLFVNVVEYETTQPENRFWEALQRCKIGTVCVKRQRRRKISM